MPFTQEFHEGDRVTVRQGRQEYPGTVLAEAVGIDFTHYYVLLDEGGEGWWSENEMTATALRATAAHTAEVNRRRASQDYPELEGVLESRPDLPQAMDETEYMRSLSKVAIFLPLAGEPGASVTNQAYQEGFEQGQVGVTQTPSSHDPAWMGDYRLGWAAGIKSRSQVPEPQSTYDLYEQEPNLPDMRFDPDMGGPGSLGRGWIHSAALATSAGIVDFLMGSPEPSDTWAGPGRNWSYDVCRFRRESHCWLPKELNREASDLAGYAVWVPEDRGHCKRVSHDAQRACPLYQPGPNEPGGFTDATVAWEDGGQRGVPATYTTDKIAARGDDDGFAWHYTAAWTDVRDKARDIARGGSVRVLAVNMYDDIHPETFFGQVLSPTGEAYNTGLTFVPGTWQVAAWECDCKWASYSWGRTRQWVKYEGRMCSHALALVYEMQSRGMSGMPDDEDEIAPDWVPKAAALGKVTRQDFPVVQALLDSGASVASIQAALHHHGVESAKTAVKGTIRGKVNGQITDLTFEDGHVYYHGQPYVGPVLYPDYHPNLGLHYIGSTKEAEMTTSPNDLGTWGLSAPGTSTTDVHEASLMVRSAGGSVPGGFAPLGCHPQCAVSTETGVEVTVDTGGTWRAECPECATVLNHSGRSGASEEEQVARLYEEARTHVHEDPRAHWASLGTTAAAAEEYTEDERRLARAFLDWFDGRITSQDLARVLDEVDPPGSGPTGSEIIRQLSDASPYGHRLTVQEGIPIAEMVVGEHTAASRRTASLTATAADVFSRREQDEIIGEGESGRASNLDRLDLAGTHYAPMDEMTHYNDDDTLWP